MEQKMKDCVAVAALGWGAFIAVSLYGYFVYGPQQFKAGADSGARPVDTSVPVVTSNDPLAPNYTLTSLGIISAVNGDGFVLNENQNVLDLLLTDETELIARTTIVSAPNLAPDVIQSGSVSDEEITVNDLRVGQQAEVRYMINEDGEKQAMSVIVFQSR